MELLEGILSRRSVRKFTGAALAPQQLETIIKVGMYSPSAHNVRPWRVVTVEDRQTRMTIRELSVWWKMLDKAATLIVICADPSADTNNMPREYIVDSCAASIQNMLLASHSLGLGAVWLGLCEEIPAAAEIKSILNIPADMQAMGMIALGIPEGGPASPIPPVNRFEEENWHKERWQ